MALTNKSITQYIGTIDKYTQKLNAEGQDLTDAKSKSVALVNSMVDDSIAINQKIEQAVKQSQQATTTTP